MRSIRYIPVILVLAGVASAAVWWTVPGPNVPLRVPGQDIVGGVQAATSAAAIVGTLTAGTGQPLADAPGRWSEFRGDNHTGVATDATGLSGTINPANVLWTTALGEGYGGSVIVRGRVYVIDYDAQQRADAVRCLSLADGKEIWRLSYPADVKRNHGMSRTVPAVLWDDAGGAGGVVVTMGPKCDLAACDAETGKLLWIKDLVREYGTKVPPWYAGQCPLVVSGQWSVASGGTVIVAPAGRKVLMTALDAHTGETLWETPNTRQWSMTHSSVIPVEISGTRMLIYCGSGGVAGVDAATGKLLWDTDAWKVSIATVPSPVDLGEGRLLLSGGYGAGAMIMQVSPPTAPADGQGAWRTQVVRKLSPEEFGAEQHTPILSDGYVYGVRAGGQMVCLDRDGNVKWDSGSVRFGLGAYLLAGERIYAINDTGVLSVVEAKPEKFTLIGKAKVIPEAKECWGPLALADGRLVVRDLTRLVCLDVRAGAGGGKGSAESHGGHHE